jgi:hypothetical protein
LLVVVFTLFKENLMNIIWKIENLNRKTSDGFVISAEWQCTAIDSGYKASTFSTCSWSDATPKIAYADLTEDIVFGWIWESSVNKAAVEATLTEQIKAQKAPVKASGLPWAK